MSPVRFTLLAQSVVLAPLAITVWLVLGALAGKSVLLGACIFILPNLYFTAYAFRYRGATRAAQTVRAFYWGEMGKLVLIMMGFALAYRFAPLLNIPAVVGGFVYMIVAQWFVSVQLAKRMTH